MNSSKPIIHADPDDMRLELDALGLGYYDHLPSSYICDTLQEAHEANPESFEDLRADVQERLNEYQGINPTFIVKAVGLGEFAYLPSETLYDAIVYAQAQVEEGGNFASELYCRLISITSTF